MARGLKSSCPQLSTLPKSYRMRLRLSRGSNRNQRSEPTVRSLKHDLPDWGQRKWRTPPPGQRCQGQLAIFSRLCPKAQARLGNSCMVGRQTRQRGVVRIRDSVMKIILSALLALSVHAGVAAPANAVDGTDQYEQDRWKF